MSSLVALASFFSGYMVSSIIHRSLSRPAATAPLDKSGVMQDHEQWTTINKKNLITANMLSSIQLRSARGVSREGVHTSFDPPLIRELKGRLKHIRSSVEADQTE